MTAVAVLGANARILTNSSLPTAPSSSNPALLVYFDDIKGSDWLAPSTSDIDAWMFAIVRALYNFNLSATNESHSLVVGSRFYGISTRNSIANRLTEAYQVTAFGSAIGTGVDPDDLE